MVFSQVNSIRICGENMVSGVEKRSFLSVAAGVAFEKAFHVLS